MMRKKVFMVSEIHFFDLIHLFNVLIFSDLKFMNVFSALFSLILLDLAHKEALQNVNAYRMTTILSMV